MKILLLTVTLTIGFAGAAIAADPLEGIWKTQVDDGAYAHVTIAPCGALLCGVISRTFDSDGEYDSDNIGKNIVWDMQAKSGNRYGGGKIWQPSTDKIFNSKMTLSSDVLKVSGCIAVFCKKQTWTRVQ